MDRELLNYTQNRELSWLRFDQRVLEEARDKSVPLLERMKFVAIFTSNLDEFFMIRVGSLYDMVQTDDRHRDSRSGMTPQEQLDAIYAAVAPLYKERDKTYAGIKKELSPYGVCGLDFKELETDEKKYVKKCFKEQILPVLSPQIVDSSHPFPHLMNKDIYVTANLKHINSRKNKDDKEKEQILGIVPVPTYVSDILMLPGHDIRYIRMEKVIMEYLDLVFDQYEVSDPNYICVTRNADVSPDDEALEVTDDFRKLMQSTLHKRRRMAVVRLETAEKLTPEMQEYFCKKFKITPEQIFRTKMPMKLDYMFSIAGNLPESMKKALVYEPFSPQKSAHVQDGNMLKQVKKNDILLFYPYESMDPFLKLIKDAAADPNVMTIKITIYRLAKKARLVEYLCAAAENGKEVTVLIELRARFDEQNNIDWSKQLEEAGCTILYGFDDYKVHSKLTLITKKGPQGYSYITQIRTGNYNEKTSELYTDYSFITADLGIGEEASNVFQNLAVQKLTETTEKMLVAPLRFKSVLLDEMDRVINAAKLGRPASMILKNNSISDRDIILKLEEASCAGVRIDMIVRGICCVRAEVPGKTENLHIRSLVGRYLEHGRIYSFYDGVTTRIYIASGDFLTRNTECRVEVGVRVEDPVLIQKLSNILQLQLRDNVNAREMRADGSYQKVKAAPGEPLVNGQMDMYDLLRDDWLARDTASAAEPEQPEIKASERPSEPETRPEPVQVAEQPAEPAKQPATVKAAPAPAVQSAPAPHAVDRAERHSHPSLFQRLHDWLRR